MKNYQITNETFKTLSRCDATLTCQVRIEKKIWEEFHLQLVASSFESILIRLSLEVFFSRRKKEKGKRCLQGTA